MGSSKFNWFSGDTDVETEEFKPAIRKPSRLSIAMDFAAKLCSNILIVAIFFRALTFILGKDPFFLGVKLNIYLDAAIVSLGLLLTIRITRMLLVLSMVSLGLLVQANLYLKLYKLLSLALWLLANIYLLRLIKAEIGGGYRLFHRLLLAGMITSIAYSGTELLYIYFREVFMRRTLMSRFRDVESSERILCVMKNYRYCISEPSSPEAPGCSCKDIFCFRNDEEMLRRNEEDGSHAFSFGLRINPPELNSAMDAKTLARDVFRKATRRGEVMSYDEFSKIFPTPQIALGAFAFFDVNNDKAISKQEFKDAILAFYMNRVSLEQSIERCEDFVEVVESVMDVTVFVLLCFGYLVIFGTPVRELLALALSTVLALNFIANGIANDAYYSLMLLLSHQYDVGDDLIVDGVEYRVYEFGMTSTSMVGENGGKVKFLNSDLWRKTLVNMTRAPEKIIVFDFEIDGNTGMEEFLGFKNEIHKFIKKKSFDYEESFSLQAKSEGSSGVNTLPCALLLKCKNYKNRSKKLLLRIEMTSFLKDLIPRMNLQPKD
jgi:small-conductance mechanosensitive channel